MLNNQITSHLFYLSKQHNNTSHKYEEYIRPMMTRSDNLSSSYLNRMVNIITSTSQPAHATV